MKVTMGEHQLDLPGKYFDTMIESNDIYGDAGAMQVRMEERGYLLFRDVLNKDTVMRARLQMMEALNDEGLLDENYPIIDGVAKDPSKGGFRGGSNRLTQAPAFVELVREGEVIKFFERFLGGEVRPYDYRWLRIAQPGKFTAMHYDVVYMGRGTKNLFTAWIPLGGVPIEHGALAVLEGSHKFERVKETYGQMDVDRDNFQGMFSTDPVEVVDRHGGQWKTTFYNAGDLLVFGMYTMHGSLTNLSNHFRLSSDTRYQLASEPIDERWIGENPKSHYAWGKEATPTPTAELRKVWGV
ncbi:MAG: phytanoyl-CoA dioxygenase family protein [Planctomycetota bacterium]|nr:phytanoyl-CoA dioxygenase family protein [Planctomycetota bacterium]MDA1140552.1 phytanoyl-CoA dioxygenase family protein [Planctomycetota bacterium]